jgi:hypothetical protein
MRPLKLSRKVFNLPGLCFSPLLNVPVLCSKYRIARYQLCSTILVNHKFMARPTLADGQVPVLLTPNNGTCPPFLVRHRASLETAG